MRLRVPNYSVISAFVLTAISVPAAAQYEPVIAISGRAGVPVVIHGVDATGAMVEGDWGLARPGAAVTVFDPGPFLIPLPPQGAYFPATGRRPRYGRHEVDFPARLRPAQTYRRSWVASSGHAPANTEPQFVIPNFEVSAPIHARPSRERIRGRR